jgi:hypothetical protein
MKTKIELTPPLRQRLEEMVAEASDATTFKRARAILWLAEGESLETVAKRLVASPEEVERWAIRFYQFSDKPLEERLVGRTASGVMRRPAFPSSGSGTRRAADDDTQDVKKRDGAEGDASASPASASSGGLGGAAAPAFPRASSASSPGTSGIDSEGKGPISGEIHPAWTPARSAMSRLFERAIQMIDRPGSEEAKEADERRKAQRIGCRFDATFRLSLEGETRARIYKATVLDVSWSGIRLRASDLSPSQDFTNLPAGLSGKAYLRDKGRGWLTIARSHWRLEALLKVVWVSEETKEAGGAPSVDMGLTIEGDEDETKHVRMALLELAQASPRQG